MAIKPPLHYASTTTEQKRLSRQSREGKLRRLLPSLYIEADIVASESSELVRGALLDILDLYAPQAVLAWRSALTLQADASGTVYLVDGPGANGARSQQLDSLTLRFLPGNTRDGLQRVTPHLKAMTPARVLLESIQAENAGRRGGEKFLSREDTEAELVRRLDTYGEAELNRLRDEARQLAPLLDIDPNIAEVLSQRIGALLATRDAAGVLVTAPALAHAIGDPYDRNRLALFEQLAVYLDRFTFPPQPFVYNKASWRTLSFFESYFSNYIEGTEMTIEEAEQVMFQHKILSNRTGDTHDVSACYQLCSDLEEMQVTPTTADQFLRLLQTRHGILMRGRPDKIPGHFKRANNQAGSTLFVRPEYVIGTLTRGFELYLPLAAGLKRAIFMHFLVTEVHPMDDGNGRLGRIMLNAELAAANEHKILVPTVARDNYLNGQRDATRKGEFRTIAKVLYQLQAYCAALPLTYYGETLEALTADGALMTPEEGIGLINRKLAPYRFDELTLSQ